MDVKVIRLFAALFTLILLSSCDSKKTIESVSVMSNCPGQVMENRFIVHWEDGSFSLEYGKNLEDFRQTFIKDNLKNIRHVDRDQLIQLTMKENTQANTTNELAWGPHMISAANLWSQDIQGQNVLIGVVDGMVDITHRQLRPNIAINSKEIPNNGIDDDSNGFVDDIYGVQVNKDYNDPYRNRHGSHVAGIIAADPTLGPVQGVAPKSKIIPAQFISNDGGGSIGDAIIAMNYTASRGAKIINLSWGGAPCVPNLQAAMMQLSDQDILLVTAAGNEGINLDRSPDYPAAFNIFNQINVAASSMEDFMIYFSNRGFRTVHLAAPGVNIFSTVPGNQVIAMDGTSMSAPMVSGSAALLWSALPSASAQQIKQALMRSVDVKSGHEFEVQTRGRINVEKAYNLLKSSLQ